MRCLSHRLPQCPSPYYPSKENFSAPSQCQTQIDGELPPILNVSIDTDQPFQRPVQFTRSIPSPFPRSSRNSESRVQELTPHTVLLRCNGLQLGHRTLLHRLRVRHREVQYRDLGRQHPTSRYALPECVLSLPFPQLLSFASPKPKTH